MTTTPTERAVTLTERVAEEIRALLGRKRITGAALARSLGVSEAWVSYRLSGKQTIDLGDLERIAAALGVAPVELLPADIRRPGQPTVPKVTPADRPSDNRPKNRAAKGVEHGPGVRRSHRTRALTQEERILVSAQGSLHE
jgi:transcriptional regulator with XRE-family HTH domain